MAAPDTYIHGHQASVLRSHRWRTAENSAGYLLPELTSGRSVLDIGCGPGSITMDFAEAVAPGQTIGLDRAEAPLAGARAAAAQRAIGNVAFTVGDVYQLDFPDDSFDVVHAHQVLQHLTDPIAALREMRRVCRPGGVVAARDADYAAMTWYPPDPRMDRWLALHRRIASDNGGELDAGRRLLAWASAAGFRDVAGTASVWCFATAEDRSWWGGTWADRVVESSFAHQAVARRFVEAAELQDLAQGWRDWSEHPDGWFAVLHGEIICRVV